jgi:glycosyltransferase involved in cell wall biosynthesis
MADALDILVVAPNAGSSFVEADVAGLDSRGFRVERVAYRDYGGKPAFLREIARRLRRGRPPLVLLWFLSPAYALETIALARAFGARVGLIVGGLEVDYVPELRLGGLRWPHNRLRQKAGVRAVDLVLPHSRFVAGRIAALARPRRLELVELGIDVGRFTPDGRAKEPLVLTVCFEVTRETAVLKGLPTLLDTAVRLPEAAFVVVGRSGGDDQLARLESTAPANVTFTGAVSDEELIGLYRRAKVYAQLSAHEAFGVAVVESMACECIPVLSDRGSLPEVAGGEAHYVSFGSAGQAADAIQAALAEPDGGGSTRRLRVVERYDVQRRFDELSATLEPYAGGGLA